MTTSAPAAPAPATNAPQAAKAPTAPAVDPKAPAPGAGTPPPATPEQKAEAKKWKLVVDGKEEEVDEPELVRRAQKAKGAELRFQEAAQLRKQLETVASTLKNPKEVFNFLKNEFGYDPKKLASEFLYENYVRPETMTPEQKKMAEIEQRALAAEEQLKQFQEKEQQAQMQVQVQAALESLNKEMGEALQESGLPKNPQVVKQAAAYMQIAMENGVQITAKEALAVVKDEIRESLKHFVTDLDGDKLEEWFGQDVTEKFRLQSLKKLSGNKPENAPPPQNSAPEQKPVKWLTEKEFDQRFKQG